MRNVLTVTTPTYTTTIYDYLILVDATANNITITLLPAAAHGVGRTITYRIKRLDSSANTVTVIPSGADLIDDLPSMILMPLVSKDFNSDGISRYVVS